MMQNGSVVQQSCWWESPYSHLSWKNSFRLCILSSLWMVNLMSKSGCINFSTSSRLLTPENPLAININNKSSSSSNTSGHMTKTQLLMMKMSKRSWKNFHRMCKISFMLVFCSMISSRSFSNSSPLKKIMHKLCFRQITDQEGTSQ